MDPLFNNDDMNAFVESIVGMEIDTIRGYIVADKSMKDTLRYGEGWCWDDDNYVLSPLLVGREDIFVATLKTRLAEAGICVDEAVDTIGTIPVGTYALCTRTHTLDQVLMPMMKDSKNLYAESMAYQIAAQNGRMKASYKHAKTHMQKLINRIGLRALDYRLADGSGLSLYNYVSAQLLVALLRHAYRNSEIFIHLYPSLPIAGVDGTLAKRMRKSHAFDNVHAKTGTLTGVISLAGYCRAANGHMLAFAILNQGVLNAARARAFQDKVCEALCCP
jgi:D-alanyl-D-alanine carboxypeptidase/D-alanyl-D-alanine-endopeptidase (penicillin-binding protein 4)